MELTLFFFSIYLLNYSICLNLLESLRNITDITTLCPSYKEVEHAAILLLEQIAGDDESQQTLHIQCNPGYELVGPPKILCIHGQWEQTKRPQCVALCDIPPYISNGEFQIEGNQTDNGMYKKGVLVTYSCKNGYKLIPPESRYRVCEKGIWTGAHASCVIEEVPDCNPPKDISNGYYVHEKSTEFSGMYSVGQRLHFSCKSGFMLIGAPVQQCLEDGVWSPKLPPICIREETGKGID